MIKMYDVPQKIKLVDLFSKNGKKYYIQKFEYGDFGNWVTAVICKRNIVVNDHSLNSNCKKDGKYSVYFETTYIPVDEIDSIVGGLWNSKRKIMGCSDPVKIGIFAELENLETIVIGEWTRE